MNKAQRVILAIIMAVKTLLRLAYFVPALIIAALMMAVLLLAGYMFLDFYFLIAASVALVGCVAVGNRVSTIMPGSVATDFGGSAGSNLHEPWKLSGKAIAEAVIDIYRYPRVALVSRIEIRPSQPPRKG